MLSPQKLPCDCLLGHTLPLSVTFVTWHSTPEEKAFHHEANMFHPRHLVKLGGAAELPAIQ